MSLTLCLNDVLRARERIEPHVHQTPVMTSAHLNRLLGAELFFKCENLQKVGAFKARGACNAVFSLSDTSADRGVLTHSSGNHGQALCYAAARRGIAATVVMPENAPTPKKAAVLEYGGTVVECLSTISARESTATRIQEQSGAEFIHPYDDQRVIAGQGTCALEFLDQVDVLDAIMAPVGGGGLIAGTCLAFRAMSPDTRIYAAEPAGADDARRSHRAGRLLPQENPVTIADGLRTGLGNLTWPFISQDVSDVLLADDPGIIVAMRLIWERMKLIVEPSAAVPLAALLARPERFRGKRVGIILSGGNVDFDTLPFSGLHPPDPGSLPEASAQESAGFSSTTFPSGSET